MNGTVKNMLKTENKSNLLVFLVSLLICLLIFELFVRAVWMVPQRGYPEGIHISDEVLGYKLKPDFSGYFPKYLGNISISINSQGLRDYERDYTKSQKRILMLGDSVTFGSGVDFEEIYPRLLEQKLNESGYDYEIIKTGVGGYEFSQEYDYYFHEGYKYNPDIVIINVVLNDIFQPDLGRMKENFEKYGDYNSQDSAIKSLVKKTCHSCVFIYSIVHNYNNDYFGVVYKTWENESELAEYSNKLNSLNSELKSKNVTLFLVIFPYADQFGNSRYGLLPQEKIKSLAKSQNISYIDLTSFLDVADYKKYYLSYDRLHMNTEGNKFVTEIVYSDLILKGMLK